MNVHLIDDDKKLHTYLEMYFSDENIESTFSENPIEAFEKLKLEKPDIIVLDIMMPKMNGFDACKKIKMDYPEIPIIMLTAKDDDIDSLLGLELGADDYIIKPFNPKILIARIKTVLRRTEKKENQNKDCFISEKWQIKLNLESYKVTLEDEIVKLTTDEFQILKILMENRNIILSREKLISLKNIDSDVFDRTIDVQISKIRSKLNDTSKPAKIIKTIRGVGYMFSEE